MGRDKASLPFGPESMLQRVVRLVTEVVAPERIAVVAAAEQSLPRLPDGVLAARDSAAYLGPLAGLATGLQALGGRADAAYATACDVPLLVPAFVQRLFDRLGDYDVVVPRDAEYHHPLAAVYRASVLPAVDRLLKADRMRPVFLFEQVRTCEIPVDEFRDVDPQLASLQNLNDPASYAAALRAAGFSEAWASPLRGEDKIEPS